MNSAIANNSVTRITDVLFSKDNSVKTELCIYTSLFAENAWLFLFFHLVITVELSEEGGDSEHLLKKKSCSRKDKSTMILIPQSNKHG